MFDFVVIVNHQGYRFKVIGEASNFKPAKTDCRTRRDQRREASRT